MAPLQKTKSANQKDQLQIQHFTHQHVLHKIYMTFEFNCDGCNTGGYGVRFRCSACDFDLHEKCATDPHRISSHLHPHHQLVLVNRPGDSHFCDVCQGLTNGLSYTCESPTCEFDLHPLCFQTPVAVATGVPSLTTALGQPTTEIGSYHPRNNSQPMMVNHHHQQQQQMQGTPTTSFGQPVMVNHQQQQQKLVTPTASFGGYNGVNNCQPVMTNQQQQTTAFSGYQGMNEPMMVNHHQMQPAQGTPTTAFSGYQGMNNSQPMMVNQQQWVPLTAFGGYNGVNNNQQLTMNNYQQQQGVPTTAFCGYNGVNNSQQVMVNQQQQGKPNNYSKVGKFAANILTTSLIGIPLFNTRN